MIDFDSTIAAAIVFTVLLPGMGYLYMAKANNSEVKNLQEWLKAHAQRDDQMFKELRDGHKELTSQISHVFETLVLEIRRAGDKA
jgi:uncharacterized membrane protein YvbJ